MDYRLLRKRLRTYKDSVMVIFLTVACTTFIDLTGYNIFKFMGLDVDRFDVAPIVFIMGLLLATATFLNKYLGRGIYDESNLNVHVNDNIDNNYNVITDNIKADIQQDIALFKKEIEQNISAVAKKAAESFDNNQRSEVMLALKERIFSETAPIILEELSKSTKKIVDAESQARLNHHFMRTMNRLSDEIKELGKRSKVNLMIGSVTALSGVSIFLLFVFQRATESGVNSYFLKEFTPRMSLVIVIEIFAYYFLGLYKNNLSEIKYFHNELTNAEHKYVAFEEAISTADRPTIKEIIKELSKTERNFLLKKGESTVSLEDKKVAMDEHKNIIAVLASTLNSLKKQGS